MKTEKVPTPVQTTPVPLWDFVVRYRWLFLAFVIIVFLGKSAMVTYFVGSIFFLIELAFGSLVTYLVLRWLFFKTTLDAYAHERTQDDGIVESDFTRAWREMDARTKVTLSIFVTSAFFVGICIIAASIAK